MLLLEYEKCVLEWFHAAYPPLITALYGDDLDVLLSKDAIVKYPSLLYTRDGGDFAYPRPLDFYGDLVSSDGSGSRRAHVRCFAWEQEYHARIVVEKQSEAWELLNVLRQRWSYNSYVYVRHPDATELQAVGLRLLSMGVESEADNLERTGAKRWVKVHWKSQLVIDNFDIAEGWRGYRLWIESGADGERVFVKQWDFDLDKEVLPVEGEVLC